MSSTTDTQKTYRLIVSGDSSFNLANDTDADALSDFYPGVWSIKTQKVAISQARRLIAEGHKIIVTAYGNVRYHAIANRFIEALNLDQPTFIEPAQVIRLARNLAGRPANLAELKRYLKPGLQIRIKQLNTEAKLERLTFIREMHSNDMTVDKSTREGAPSWLRFGKGSDWLFDGQGATQHFIDSNGALVACTRIEYLD